MGGRLKNRKKRMKRKKKTTKGGAIIKPTHKFFNKEIKKEIKKLFNDVSRGARERVVVLI
jgi:hypothetical protein